MAQLNDVPNQLTIEHRIEGEEAQILNCVLRQGQRIRASPGAMLYMTANVEMDSSMGGSIGKGISRGLSGENLFYTDFFYTGPPTQSGTVTFGPDFPSKIIHIPMAEHNNTLICQTGAFLCSSPTIEVHVELAKKCGFALCGGEGFLLQRLTGQGDAFIQSYGASIERNLAAGEEINVSSGSIVAFDDTVKYDIKRIKGCVNCCCGGEGMFLTVLTGPGKVYLQGIQLNKLRRFIYYRSQ